MTTSRTARIAGASLHLCGAWLALALGGCGGSGGPGDSASPGSPAPPVPPTPNQPPAVAILAPFVGSSFVVGETVSFEGTASDPEDGGITGGGLVWSLESGAALATGETYATDALAIGQHTIRLTATDDDGASSSASVTFRIAESSAPPPTRPGERNPLAGRLDRKPVKLDDELVVVGRSDADDQMVVGVVDRPIAAYEWPYGEGTAPRVAGQRADALPVAAAAGRILRSNLHQAAIVARSTPAIGPARFSLELVGLYAHADAEIARYAFDPPLPVEPIAVAVADLDAFDEVGGGKALEPPQDRNVGYHGEVALVYPEPDGGALRARIEVLSFEEVDFPENRDGPVPGPTSITRSATSEPLWPSSRIVALHGDNLYGTMPGPHLVVAYLDASRRVALDVFELRRTRADPAEPDPRTDARNLSWVQHAVVSTPLSVAAAAAGGWDVEIGEARQLGMDQVPGDVLLVVTNQGGQYREEAWKLEDRDGFVNPDLLAGRTGDFASVPDGAGGNIALSILPDSRIEAVLGRIVDPEPNRCEAIGLFVLADTNRQAVVQSMTAFIEDPDVGSYRFGPPTPGPAWPAIATIRARPETATPSGARLAAGGFVAERNALIDDRGDPAGVGTEYAHDCQDASTAPYLGPMPSFYVTEPAADLVHAVTMLLGVVQGGGAVVTSPLPASFGEAPLLLAADADGDAAYYRSIACLGSGPGDCRRIFLGDAELHYAIENLETKNVVLQQPPKHVDYLRELGGIVDVSMRSGYYAEFVQTDISSGSLTRRTRTDWSVGGRLGIGLGPPVPPKKEFKSSFDMSLDLEHESVQENFQSTQASVSLTQSTGAVDDDVVWSKLQTIDFWRFPAQGGKPTNDAGAPSGFDTDAYMEVAIPDAPVTLIGPGVLNDDYQPTHQVGNILSYPMIAGDVQDIGELFGFLGDYVPTDEDGTRRCRPNLIEDGPGCLIRQANGALQFVAQVLAGDDFVSGEFESLTNPIDVANILQVGGITYSAELEFDTDVKRGQTVTNKDSIKVQADLKIPLKPKVKGVRVPIQFGELQGQLRASASFENAAISENSLGSRTKIALHVPSDIPIERSYRIRPSFGFTPGGSLEVAYQVDTQGAAATFWDRHYAAPDPALNLPHRIVRAPGGHQLGTDFSRNRLKGFFVRDGRGIDPLFPADEVGTLLDAAPYAGDPVQLEVRVYNLSVATPVRNLAVQFSAQRYENGAVVGSPVALGEASIDYLPFRGEFAGDPNGHVASAFVLWDTSDFGPLPGDALASWVVHVTLDPANVIADERHELEDRYDDPLTGPTGEVLDPELEKGQNNLGWAMVRIAPSLSAQTAQQKPGGAGRGKAGFGAGDGPVDVQFAWPGDEGAGAVLRARPGQALELEVGLQAPALETGYGRLYVYDGDPGAGGELVMSRTVQGLPAAQRVHEQFTWRPRRSGQHVLHAVYVGPGSGDRRVVARLPVSIQR